MKVSFMFVLIAVAFVQLIEGSEMNANDDILIDKVLDVENKIPTPLVEEKIQPLDLKPQLQLPQVDFNWPMDMNEIYSANLGSLDRPGAEIISEKTGLKLEKPRLPLGFAGSKFDFPKNDNDIYAANLGLLDRFPPQEIVEKVKDEKFGEKAKKRVSSRIGNVIGGL